MHLNGLVTKFALHNINRTASLRILLEVYFMKYTSANGERSEDVLSFLSEIVFSKETECDSSKTQVQE